MARKILLVEDEADLAMIVADTLRGQGYEVTVAVNGLDGLSKFQSEGADVVVADVMMPGLDGFGMARRIRRLSPSVPILFLTAKSSIDDVEDGFEAGGNDYLKKPFELRELIVRIKALLRVRSFATVEESDVVYEIGAYTFNATTQSLRFDGKELSLSHIEARLLSELAASMGHTVDASRLMIAIWQRDDLSNRNSLHGFIHKLRRLLRHDSAITIVNQRGFGYMLVVKR
ncbi:response regulator transcription factor [uncultured Duncaniella sp.]|uniref:response regulator transcription factor n=1 Tax=uncultured Duncaniella sp. TaxID=2768039 RepID=UPI0025FA045C|nr:response regulator transcription factor [uncultured Duncaniella sp.]